MLVFSYISTAALAAAASKPTFSAGWRRCLFTGFHMATIPHACRKHATTTLLVSLQILCSSLSGQIRWGGRRGLGEAHRQSYLYRAKVFVFLKYLGSHDKRTCTIQIISIGQSQTPWRRGAQNVLNKHGDISTHCPNWTLMGLQGCWGLVKPSY